MKKNVYKCTLLISVTCQLRDCSYGVKVVHMGVIFNISETGCQGILNVRLAVAISASIPEDSLGQTHP